jgi:hypothetical protein
MVDSAEPSSRKKLLVLVLGASKEVNLPIGTDLGRRRALRRRRDAVPVISARFLLRPVTSYRLRRRVIFD